MRTKAVYVVVSDNNDVYFEQAWVSAWSLKHYNPDMDVYCIVDQDTYDNIFSCYRQNASEVIDKFVKVDVPAKYSKIERSRYLKTSVRRYIDGDFLFIDADTIICDTLGEIDSFQYPMMMVLDCHCSFLEIPSYNTIQKKVRKIISKDLTCDKYYNSGVIYCKDITSVHQLFTLWHETWKKGLIKGVLTDQQSLAIAIQHFQNTVEELDGIYNSQLRFSIKYMHRAKIMHFYSPAWYPSNTHYFFNKNVYLDISINGCITESFKEKVIDCKSLFFTPSFLIPCLESQFYNDGAHSFLRVIYDEYPSYYRCIVLISKIQTKLISFCKRVKMW